MATEPHPVCPACAGCGRVAPSPFDGPPAPWSGYVAWVAAQLSGGLPWEGSAAAAGLTRPLPCPDCDGREVLPAAVLIPDFVRLAPDPGPGADPGASKSPAGRPDQAGPHVDIVVSSLTGKTGRVNRPEGGS